MLPDGLRTWALTLAAGVAVATPGCDCDSKPDDPPVPPLAVNSVDPVQGAAAGGTAVTITGQRFTATGGVDSVTFGGAAGTSLAVLSDAQLTVVTPGGTAGPADVVVGSSGLGTTATESNGFTYLSGPPPAPTLASVAPAGGPTAGGTPVTLIGSAFQTGATADFGGSAATGVQVRSGGRLTAVSPAGAVGPVTVTVVNPDAQTGSLAAGFTYSNPPVVTGVTPGSGVTEGGTTVTITGTDFVTGATADLGGAPVSISSLTPIQIVGTSTARGPGDVAVRVTNLGGIAGSGASYSYRYSSTSQTSAFAFDTAAGIDCRRRWHLDFRALPLTTDLLNAGLQTTNAPDAANAYALDWFRGYVLQAVNLIYGRNADGTGISGTSCNVTFVGVPPGTGNPGCAVPATDFSRLCIGGCAPTTATGCPGNPAGCAGPVVGLSLFDNIAGQPCAATAEDNCTAPAYGGAGCTGVFVRDIGALWGGSLSPSLLASDLAVLDGTVLSGTRFQAVHTALQQLAYRVAVVVAHECGHSSGLVANGTASPCAQSTGLCGGSGTHNDCCAANLMQSTASFSGTFTPSSKAFSGRPGSTVSNPACFTGGTSSWAQLTSFLGLTP